MPVLLERITDESGDHLEWAFWCPGCRRNHSYCIQRKNPVDAGPVWQWNGSEEKPTFTPSLLCTWHQWEPPVHAGNMDEFERAPWHQDRVEKRCHLFVTDGKIHYCGDCHHELAGKTVPMVDFDKMGE